MIIWNGKPIEPVEQLHGRDERPPFHIRHERLIGYIAYAAYVLFVLGLCVLTTGKFKP